MNFKKGAFDLLYSDLIFLLALFPISIILSLFDRSAEYKNFILILASLVFFLWGKPILFGLIFLSSFIDWLLGFMAGKKGLGKIALGLDFVMNTALLFIFGHNYMFQSSPKLLIQEKFIPIFIGFYTLKGFAYVYDVHKGNTKHENNYFYLLTYMISFHTIAAGPLMRYNDIKPQLRKREITVEKLNYGLLKIIWGLAKVVMLGGAFSQISDSAMQTGESAIANSWIGMLAYFAQYYFMFTGYADISMGLGLTNGFEYPQNYTDIKSENLFGGMVRSFNTTVYDFFIDIFSGGKKQANFVLMMICGIFMGFWYSGYLTGVCAFTLAALLIALEQAFLGNVFGKFPSVLKYLFMVLGALFIFGLTYFHSFEAYLTWVGTLFGINTNYIWGVPLKEAIIHNLFLIIAGFCIICPAIKNGICGKWKAISEKSEAAYGTVKVVNTVLSSVLLVVCIVTLASSMV